MPIGVLCAMTGEIALLREDMEVTGRETVGGREFLTGRLYGREAVLALSGIGKVAAACAATILLDHFGAEALIFSGTAGGVDPALRTGDLVVSDRSVQHDVDAIGEALFQVPGYDQPWFDGDQRLTALAAEAAARFVGRFPRSIWPPSASPGPGWWWGPSPPATSSSASGRRTAGLVSTSATSGAWRWREPPPPRCAWSSAFPM